MSLRDQLLKAGLVDKKRVKHVERELKQQRRDEQSQRRKKSVEEAERAEAARARAQRTLDERRSQRLEREQAREQMERALRIRNLVAGNVVTGRGGQPFWHPSVDGRELLRMWVSPAAAERLRRGELAIAARDAGNRIDYVLIRAEAARALAELGARALVFHVTDLSGISSPEECFLRRDWETDLRPRRATDSG